MRASSLGRARGLEMASWLAGGAALAAALLVTTPSQAEKAKDKPVAEAKPKADKPVAEAKPKADGAAVGGGDEDADAEEALEEEQPEPKGAHAEETGDGEADRTAAKEAAEAERKARKAHRTALREEAAEKTASGAIEAAKDLAKLTDEKLAEIEKSGAAKLAEVEKAGCSLELHTLPPLREAKCKDEAALKACMKLAKDAKGGLACSRTGGDLLRRLRQLDCKLTAAESDFGVVAHCKPNKLEACKKAVGDSKLVRCADGAPAAADWKKALVDAGCATWMVLASPRHHLVRCKNGNGLHACRKIASTRPWVRCRLDEKSEFARLTQAGCTVTAERGLTPRTWIKCGTPDAFVACRRARQGSEAVRCAYAGDFSALKERLTSLVKQRKDRIAAKKAEQKKPR